VIDPAEGAAPARPRRTRRRRRLRAAIGILVRLVILAAVLGIGVALGDAYGDRPTRPATVSIARGVDVVTVTRTVATQTRTVVVTGGAQP
jgi:hypothetical protein